MNQDRIAGNWRQFKGKLQEQWGKLTDDDLEVIQGRFEQLVGRIQQRHAISQDDAAAQVHAWHTHNPNFFFEKSQ